MKVFVAGATGALGRQLVPRLVARGHEVVGMTRGASKQDLVRSLGARPVVADALDPDAVAEAVASAEPEVIVHQLTALSGPMSVRDARRPDRAPAVTMTNRLRTEGTDHLLAAGRAVGARRFVAQSIAAFRFASTGGPVQTEADPLDPNPPAALRTGQEAILYLEQAVTTIEWGEGLALRYGGFYGPGTGISLAADAVMAGPVRKRRFPLVGDGGGVWSHIHIEDAAAATAIAVERGRPGIYNVVDDEPAPVREWLPVLASALGAKPPRRVPRWLGRVLAGEAATAMMDRGEGCLEREGEARARLAAALCELAAGLRAGARLSDDRTGVRPAAPVGVRDRLPDAGQRIACVGPIGMTRNARE
jgi:nucleoside-diphosphate-sugar epimerase